MNRIDLVAKVGNRAVTSRDLLIYKALFSTRSSASEEDLKSQVVTDLMLSVEADALGLQPSSETMQAQKDFALPLPEQRALLELEATASEIGDWRKRRILADMLIEQKQKSVTVEPTDEQVKTYYYLNKSKFGDLPFEKFRQGIVDTLRARERDTAMKDWFESLRRNHRVRIKIPLVESSILSGSEKEQAPDGQSP